LKNAVVSPPATHDIDDNLVAFAIVRSLRYTLFIVLVSGLVG